MGMDDSKIDQWILAEDALATDVNLDRRVIYADYTVDLTQGETFVMEKFVNVSTTRDRDWAGLPLPELQKASLEALRESAAMGYADLAEESAQQWQKEVWDAAPIVIEGDSDSAFDQFAVRFAQYHMRVMLPSHDNRMNIGAKGLSGEGYKGHCFWDTEIFLLPYYIFTDPAAARKLEEYRYLSLPGAHRKAQANGYKGAMFPWESAWLDDGETCPLYVGTDILTGTPIKVWSGIIEQHITADVAFGVWQCTIYGFGGLRMLDGKLRIRPRLPKGWDKLRYTLLWKGQKLQVTVTQEKLTVQNLTQTATVELELNGTQCTLGDQAVTAALLP